MVGYFREDFQVPSDFRECGDRYSYLPGTPFLVFERSEGCESDEWVTVTKVMWKWNECVLDIYTSIPEVRYPEVNTFCLGCISRYNEEKYKDNFRHR